MSLGILVYKIFPCLEPPEFWPKVMGVYAFWIRLASTAIVIVCCYFGAKSAPAKRGERGGILLKHQNCDKNLMFAKLYAEID